MCTHYAPSIYHGHFLYGLFKGLHSLVLKHALGYIASLCMIQEPTTYVLAKPKFTVFWPTLLCPFSSQVTAKQIPFHVAILTIYQSRFVSSQDSKALRQSGMCHSIELTTPTEPEREREKANIHPCQLAQTSLGQERGTRFKRTTYYLSTSLFCRSFILL